MLCVRCGLNNSFDGSVCSKCGAALPKIPDLLSMPKPWKGNLERLEEISNSIYDGSINYEEFESCLRNIYETVEDSMIKLRNMKRVVTEDSDMQLLMDEGYEKALAGSEMMIEAVMEIWACTEHWDPQFSHEDAEHTADHHIETGLSLAREATDILNRSIEISDEIQTKLGVTKGFEALDEVVDY